MTKFLRNIAPFLAGRAGEPQRLADLAGLEVGQAEAHVDRLAMDLLRASCAATVSISTPPSVEAISTGHLQAAVDRQAEVELAGDVVADGDQHLGDRLALRRRSGR